MKNRWPNVMLGEMCHFEKGTSPTLKTESGPYPLVVTASYRRTSTNYQFDKPAVCIPLVSSTGHGNAAIHRIHYQEGKFALANLLVAVIPHQESDLNAKFLWRYLSAKKDKILVPLMQGTANVSLKEQDIKKVKIAIPPIQNQLQIVRLLDAIESRLNQVKKLRDQQEQEIDALLSSVFHKIEAKAEWIEMAEVAPIHRRPTEISPDGKYPEIGARSFGKGLFHKPVLHGSSLSWQKLYRVQSGDIVISNIKAWEGAIAVARDVDHDRYGSHRYLTCVADQKRALPEFICFYLLSSSGLEQIGKASPGSADRNRTLAMNRLEKIKIPIVPLKLQQEFKMIHDLRTQIQQKSSKINNELSIFLSSLLDQTFSAKGDGRLQDRQRL